MAQNDWGPSLAGLLTNEGGYSNNVSDRGGATNFGVTQNTYNTYLANNGLPQASVRSITPDQVGAIYKTMYWDPIRADELPAGLDHAVFDFYANSGALAPRFLNRALGLSGDTITDQTIAAANASKNLPELIGQLTAMRQSMVQGSSKIDDSLKPGLTTRIDNARAQAMQIYNTPQTPPNLDSSVIGAYPTTPQDGTPGANDPGSATLGRDVQPINYNTLIDWNSFANKSATDGYGAKYGDFQDWVNTNPGPTDFANGSQAGTTAPGSLGEGITPSAGYNGAVGPQDFSGFGPMTYGDAPVDPSQFSTDPNGAAIASLYAAALKRAPDAAGLAGWEDQLKSGKGWGDISAGIIGSPEYAALHPGESDKSFIDNVYQNALGRAVDPSGAAAWGTALDNGASRADVLRGIAGSQEAAQHIFDNPLPAFGATSQTSPAANGSLGDGITPVSYNSNIFPTSFADWSSTQPAAPGSLGAGITPIPYSGDVSPNAFGAASGTSPTGNGSLGDGITPSNAYNGAIDPGAFGTNTATTPVGNGSFGDGIVPSNGYNGNVSPTAFADGSQAGTTAPGSLGAGITPDPYQQNLTSLYAGILGRSPDQAGLTGWENALNNGASYDSVAQGIFASPEAQARYGGDTAPLNANFNNIFGRNIDTSTPAASWNVSPTAFGATSSTTPTQNGQLGSDVTPNPSDPYAANLNSLYAGILGRTPDQPGLTGWEDQLNKGASYDSVAAGIFGSPEAQAKWGGDTSALNGTFNNIFGRDIDLPPPPSSTALPEISANQPSPTGNAWSDSYLATNAMTNGMNASANQGAETLMNNSAAINNQMLANQLNVGQQQQNQFLQNQQTFGNPAPFGAPAPAPAPTLLPFTGTIQPSYAFAGPTFI